MSDFLSAVHAWATEGWNDEYRADPSVDNLARMAHMVSEIRTALGQTRNLLDEELKEIIGHGQQEVEGFGLVEVKNRAKAVKWDSEGVLLVLAAQAMDERQMDPETGEMLERPEEALLRVLRECSPITTPSHAWRAATRARLGDRLDEYQTVGGWDKQVVITPHAHAADYESKPVAS